MKKILLLLLTLITTFKLIGQTCPVLTTTGGSVNCTTSCVTLTSLATPINSTTNYTVSSVPYTPFSYTTGTNVATGTDDVYDNGVTIPFCFNFFGNSYTTLYIGSNGNISFNPSVSGAFDPWSLSGPLPGSNSSATYDAIMSPLCDIYPPGGGGTIKYTTYGTSPCRAFVISFNNLTMFLPGTYCTGDRETSQIVLYETSNIIDIYIGDHNSPTLCTSWNSGYAVTGIENLSGTTFYTAPGENGTAFTATNEGWRFTPSGTPYTWTYTWNGPSGLTPATVCPTVTTTYTSTATTTTPCSTITLTMTATVISSVSPMTISGPATVCQGNTITLSSGGGAWSSSNPSVGSVSPTGIVSGVSQGTCTITCTSGGCVGTKNITVYPTYNQVINAVICNGQSYLFDGSTFITSGIYPHTFTTINGCDSIVTLNLTVYPTYTSSINSNICQGDTINFGGTNYTTSGIYSHTFITNHGCDSIVTLNLSVHQLPSFGFYVKPYVCIGDTTTIALTNHSSDITDFTWIWPTGTNIITSSSDHGGPFTITFNASGTYTITSVATNGLCTKSISDTINVSSYPDARIDEHDNDVCFDAPILFRAYNIQYGYYYIWGPAYTFYPSNADNLHNAWAYGVIDSNHWITLTVETPYGCKSIDSTYINGHSCCELEIPTAFTPNGDGKNDKFGPIGQYYKLHDFRIFNRFGQVVYETIKPGDKWDGTFDGVCQDLGVYFWYIIYECDGKQIFKKGDVTLIR